MGTVPDTTASRAAPFWLTFTAMMMLGGIATVVFISRDSLYSAIVFSTTPEVISALGGVDPANYLRLATDLAQGNAIVDNRWILMLWPPGMSVVYAALLLLPGPIVIKAAVLSVVVWSAAGAFITSLAWRSGGRIRAAVFAAFWVLGSGGIGWAYGPGLMFSDGIGAALVVVVIGCVYRFARSSTTIASLTLAGVAGATLGASLYFRWAFLGIVVLFAAAACLTAAVALLLYSRKRRGATLRLARSSLVFFLGIAVIVMPWTLVAGLKLHPGSFSWSNGDYQWSQRWLTDDQLVEAPFLIDGNANWACEVDADSCEELNEEAQDWPTADLDELRDRALLAAVTNPVPFAGNRIDALARAWVAGPGQDMKGTAGLLSGIATLLAFVFLIFATFQNLRSQRILKLTIWLLLAGLVSVLMAAHLEARYLLPVHAVIWTSVALLPMKNPFARRLSRSNDGEP